MKQFYLPQENDILSQTALNQQRTQKMFNAQRGYIVAPSSSNRISQTSTQLQFTNQKSIDSLRSYRQSGLDEEEFRRSSIQQQEEDLTQEKDQPKQQKDVIQIRVEINETDKHPADSMNIKIHISRDVIDLYNQTEKYLKSTQNYDTSQTELFLLYKNQILKKQLSLKEAGIQSNCTIHVLTQDKNFQPTKQRSYVEDDHQQQAAPKEDDAENQIIPKHLLPKQPKEGYQTIPEFLDIARMTLREVRKIKDFKIFNEHGSIHFLGETDLTQVDLREIVTITKGAAQVYNDEDPKTIKPEVGQKLNRPALITLNDMDIKSKKTYSEKVEIYKMGCQKQGSEYVSYDMNKKQLVFRVEHFTKYGFDEDDSEIIEQVDSQQLEAIRDQQAQQQYEERIELARFLKDREHEEQLRELDQKKKEEERLQAEKIQAYMDKSMSMTGSNVKGSIQSQDQNLPVIPNILDANKFPNKLYSDPNHILNPKFKQKMMKPYQQYDVEKLFTTQPKSTTIFDNQQTTIKQSNVPSYQEPLKIEKKIYFEGQNQILQSAFISDNSSGIAKTKDAIINQGSQNQKQSSLQSFKTINQIPPISQKQSSQQEDKSVIFGKLQSIQEPSQNEEMDVDYERMSQQSKGKRRLIDESQSIGGDSRMSEVDMVDLTKRRQYQTLNVSQVSNQRTQKIASMRERIQKKQQMISDFMTMEDESETLTTDQTIDIFTNLKISVDPRKIVKPVKMIRCRPVFTPNGNLLTVTNTNQIKQVQIPLDKNVNLEQNKKAYEKVSDILMNHGQFKQDRLEPNLGQRFESLQLQRLQQDGNVNQNHLQPQQFNDQFIERFMANMVTNTLEFPSDPVDIFYFLEDLAAHIVEQIKESIKQKNKYLKRKLQEEFYVICTLNALFGNPCIQLVQLHPEFKGLNTFQKQIRAFGKNGLNHSFIDGHTPQIEKQRRNALTEVIRFLCQQEFKVPPQLDPKANVYDIAQHHMFNGDLKSAVSHLNQQGKTKFAQILTQTMTSTSSKAQLNNLQQKMPNIYSKFNQKAQDLMKFLGGNQDSSNLQQKSSEWARWLQYYLTIKVEPNVTLNQLLNQYDREIYQQFDGGNVNANLNQNQKHRYPLIYFLIKLYNEQPANRAYLIQNYLVEFRNIEPTQVHNVQDHRLQLITVLVLYYVQRHYKINNHYYNNKYQSFEISDSILARCAIQYVHQLIRQDDWKQALLVVQMIPVQAIKVKKMMMLHILLQKGVHLVHHQNLLPNFAKLEYYRIPKNLLQVSRAMYYEYRRQYEYSMEDWINAQNLIHSHRLFLDKLVPLYFDISNVNDLRQDINLRQNSGLFHEILTKHLNLKKLNAYDINKDLLIVFLNIIEGVHQSRDPRDLEKLMKDISLGLGDKQTLQKNNFQRFIWEYLLNLDLQLKSKKVSEITGHQTSSFDSRKNVFDDRNNEYLPIVELVNIYHSNPVVLKYLDGFTTENLTKISCHKVNLDKKIQVAN